MAKFQACPKCNRRGLHYADHPHAQGWKDYGRVVCRFCGARFRVKERDAELHVHPAEAGGGCTCPRSDTGSILYWSQDCSIHRLPRLGG